MKGQTAAMVRWFFWWGWATEKVEAWLEGMAAQGWHVVKADRWLLRFHFVKGPKKSVRVCVDYQTHDGSEEYKVLFQDAGWELLATFAGYYIWRAEYDGATRPEIFSDVDSLIARNNRLLLLFSLALLAQVPAWLSRRLSGILDSFLNSTLGKVVVSVYLVCVLVLILGAVATVVTNTRLRSKKP